VTADRSGQPFSGYHRILDAREDAELTHVEPRTPCGEYMRRFWQPVAMSSQIRDLPIVVKVLGEELVLFRDLSGRIGLLHKHCSHRRASLEYGILVERGIRCCYHGWLYDIDGHILETPGGPRTARSGTPSATALIPRLNTRASSSPIWGRPSTSRNSRSSTPSSCPGTTWCPTPSTTPATGCRSPRTRWIRSTACFSTRG
jgi:nitrite reductase/ring-hydroxylating ferredoxin subunit